MEAPRKASRIEVDEGNRNEQNMQGDVSQYPEGLQRISDMQGALDDLNIAMAQELREVELKYQRLKREKYMVRAVAAYTLPGFWGRTLGNCLDLPWSVEDQSILDCLVDFDVDASEPDTITISMTLGANDYIANEKLVKVLSRKDDWAYTSDITTTIQWLDGRNEARDSNTNKRPHQTESFFDWFSNPAKEEEDPIVETLTVIFEDPLKYYLSETGISTVVAAIEGEEEAEVLEVDDLIQEHDIEDYIDEDIEALDGGVIYDDHRDNDDNDDNDQLEGEEVNDVEYMYETDENVIVSERKDQRRLEEDHAVEDTEINTVERVQGELEGEVLLEGTDEVEDGLVEFDNQVEIVGDWVEGQENDEIANREEGEEEGERIIDEVDDIDYDSTNQQQV